MKGRASGKHGADCGQGAPNAKPARQGEPGSGTGRGRADPRAPSGRRTEGQEKCGWTDPRGGNLLHV
ncbi:hypothetical protein NHX12_002180 [Muraenolepis orangiensis]|uniref:Uncharacterized protein n=1 Tax=Muraenolepis orangiensis TaxID=630683 RepID=A0A9Q0IHY5_9TELE|nr:hypothetical protein NHX12_002180 [Muraenolepis orangiensis]